ncbi:alpha-hydroxy-acid oxidizing protein [Desulfocurvibacter africanus]|uniref:(S)-2-hydroxy-acid oxidase n=2 Tax=Desulfocurvibacter africanus TaxID=873 RepID=F3Z089_DESAF|nr:alpha-hydroxy-acid oxidizing protein [Desulfocurvibacter africanus]EGJ49791.1 (S)-2-hydroxy-acid oxidase [Desulfocurvibacter africanus subsp. africanus str. Walvis Bay]
MEMKEVRASARELMKGFCRVCPVCDGRVCAGEVPGMGGLGTGASFRANVQALADVRFDMRLLHDAATPDLSVTVLGKELALPVLAAPIGGVSFNMGGKRSEEEYVAAVLHGCRVRGTLGCSGDGVPSFIIEAGLKALRELGGEAIPFIKPWEDAELYEKLGKAAEAGARIAGIDVDAAGLVTLAKMGRPVGPKSSAKLRDIIDRFPMQFILKGIMTPDEARKARDAGAAGIVVSNHGGRVLDFTPGVADVLPKVAAAVKGEMVVLADGGVRNGVDVLKMLALGADAVLIGRPFAVAAVGGLQDGVTAYLDQLAGELRSAMVLTGTAKASQVDSGILHQ